jgi:hypothetical protein
MAPGTACGTSRWQSKACNRLLLWLFFQKGASFLNLFFEQYNLGEK